MQKQSLVVGSGRFVPARLQIARQARALKQIDLAEKLDCAPATVSRWESIEYEHTPDMQMIINISEELRVAASWFFKPVDDLNRASFFRSLRSEYVRSRDKIDGRLYFLESIVDAISPYVEFPSVDIPGITRGLNYRDYSPEHIEQFAIDLREYWGLGDDPIEDLLLIIENAGITVSEDVFDSNKLDGVSKWTSSDYPIMLLARDKGVGVRRRFDAAHELGHIVMHRGISREELQENFSLIEEQAMMFASAFLLPASTFCDDVYDTNLDCLADIKPKWKVSVAAMIKRLSYLSIISSEYERNLWKYYSYRQWRGFEPYDAELAVERPENIRSAVQLLAAEASGDLNSAIDQSGLLFQDIADLTGVSIEELEVSRKPRLRLAPRIIESASGSNVVAFPNPRGRI